MPGGTWERSDNFVYGSVMVWRRNLFRGTMRDDSAGLPELGTRGNAVLNLPNNVDNEEARIVRASVVRSSFKVRWTILCTCELL